MQRINVDFPVPDGPMMAISPRLSISSETSRSTGCPARYSLKSLLMMSDRCRLRASGACVAVAIILMS
jgi:hypothetical protein